MIGEKFYLVVSALDSSELNSCIRMSRSSFFNKKNEISETLELFKKNQNRFFSMLMNEEKLFILLFSEKKHFNRRILLDHFHYCMLFVEDFIVYNISHNDKDKKLELLEQFYAEKRIEKEFLAVNKKRIKIEGEKKISIDSFIALYQLHKTKFYYLLKQFDNEVFKEIDIAVDYLDKFYFLSKMNAFQELSSNTLMNNVEYEHILKDEIIEIIEETAEKDDELIYQIYKHTIQLYHNNFDIDRYHLLKKMIIDNIDKFDMKLKKNLLSDLTNYVSYLYNQNADNDLINESFEIIKLQVAHKTLIENNTFPESTFSQDIRIALFLEEYDWAQSFIESHKKYLKNKDIIFISKAEILYSQAKYDEMYEVIEELNKSKRVVAYDVKCLYAKALYDQEKYDLLDNYLINFSKALHRQKENSKKLLSSKNGFILYLSKMVKHMHNISKLEKMQLELTEDKHIFHRNWLNSRLNILIKKF